MTPPKYTCLHTDRTRAVSHQVRRRVRAFLQRCDESRAAREREESGLRVAYIGIDEARHAGLMPILIWMLPHRRNSFHHVLCGFLCPLASTGSHNRVKFLTLIRQGVPVSARLRSLKTKLS